MCGEEQDRMMKIEWKQWEIEWEWLGIPILVLHAQKEL